MIPNAPYIVGKFPRVSHSIKIAGIGVNARKGTVSDNGDSSVPFTIRIFAMVKATVAMPVLIMNSGLSHGIPWNVNIANKIMKGIPHIFISQFW